MNSSNPSNPRSVSSTSNKSKPLASISLDLDNQWSYMKTHGDSGWEKFPSYFGIFIPYVLGLLDQLNLKITFFIVGQDAALDKNKDVLKLLPERGHEVGNHSFHHEPWLHLYPIDGMKREILDTEDQILRVTGEKPVGFRGPGFSWSTDLFEVLLENNYIYDASTLPTYIGPLARLYYFWTSEFSAEEKNQRKELFGKFRDGLRPVKAYNWQLNSDVKLLEIPVSTMPLFKIPFHQSYLLFLSRFSIPVMLSYLRFALALCRLTNTEPSFLIHPTDLLDSEQVPRMRFFPGMEISAPRKLETLRLVINELSKHYMLANMRAYAESILKQKALAIIKPSKEELLKN